MHKPPFTTRPDLAGGLTFFVVLGAILAPWWRNRLYLKDFFDYGLMMTASGRINAGEKPFVDFTTPLQSASYWVNAWVERLFGATYASLTLGNGIFIVVSFVLLTAVLRLTVPWVTASLVAGAVVVGSASQHTIIWYNAMGVILLAIVVWGTACVPVLKRENRGTIILICLALIISGTNKINFHAVTLAGALAWTLRAGINRHAPWTDVARTTGLWIVAGVGCPILVELGTSGATWDQWVFNVFVLPFTDRGSNLAELLTLQFYLRPMHDYYGPVIQPVGAILMGWLTVSAVLAWRKRDRLDRVILIGAMLFSVGAIGGLLATNHEIVYISLAAGIVLLIAIWIGFDLMSAHRWRTWALITPTVLLGIVMGHSAWLGQRSQFGHSHLPRDEYVELPADNPVFAYLSGLKIPPALGQSLQELSTLMPEAQADELYRCYYVTGAEFLERLWPNQSMKGMPLLMDSLTFSSEQRTKIQKAFGMPPRYRLLIGMEAWVGSWPAGMDFVRKRSSSAWKIGVFSIHRFNRNPLERGLRPQNDALEATAIFGGNMDPHAISFSDPMWPFELGDGRTFLGTFNRRGSFIFERPSLRLNGQFVVQRETETAPLHEQDVTVKFAIYDATIPENTTGALIWQETATLPAGEGELVQDYHIDSRGRPVRFVTEIPPEHETGLRAGYLLPRITHSGDAFDRPPQLRLPAASPEFSGKDLAAKVLPPEWAEDTVVLSRGAQIHGDQVHLLSGSELWLKPKRPIREIRGKITFAHPPSHVRSPIVQVVWYRGGRLELLRQGVVHPPDATYHFDAWPAEPDGWYGILLAPHGNSEPLKIEITTITAPE